MLIQPFNCYMASQLPSTCLNSSQLIHPYLVSANLVSSGFRFVLSHLTLPHLILSHPSKDFFNMRFSGIADGLSSSHDAGALILTSVSNDHTNTSNGNWTNWNFTMIGQAPSQILLPDPRLCCQNRGSVTSFQQMLKIRRLMPMETSRHHHDTAQQLDDNPPSEPLALLPSDPHLHHSWTFGDTQTCSMRVMYSYRICHTGGNWVKPVTTELKAELATDSSICKRWFIRAGH